MCPLSPCSFFIENVCAYSNYISFCFNITIYRSYYMLCYMLHLLVFCIVVCTYYIHLYSLKKSSKQEIKQTNINKADRHQRILAQLWPSYHITWHATHCHLRVLTEKSVLYNFFQHQIAPVSKTTGYIFNKKGPLIQGHKIGCPRL